MVHPVCLLCRFFHPFGRRHMAPWPSMTLILYSIQKMNILPFFWTERIYANRLYDSACSKVISCTTELHNFIQDAKALFKVPLTPKIFLLLKKSTSFPDFISEKIISIDKILAFLQAFEHAIPMFTTAQSGIWVGLLVTSLQEPSWNTQETFDWDWRAVKHFWVICDSYFIETEQDFYVKELYHLALQFGV